MTAQPDLFLRECADRFGGRFTLRLTGAGTMVVLSDPVDVRAVFAAPPEVLGSAPAVYAGLRPVLGANSLFLLDGDRHRRHRDLIMLALRADRIARFARLMAHVTKRHMASWPVGERFPLAPRMQAITLEIITRAVFGELPAERAGRLHRALQKLVGGSTHCAATLAFAPPRSGAWRSFEQARAVVDDIVLEEVTARRGGPRAHARDDVLSVLMTARDGDLAPLEPDELCDELVTLLVGGHESTAVALTWAFERVMRHPPVAERLKAECETESETSFADAIVREALRIRSPAPFVARRVCGRHDLSGSPLPIDVTLAPCPHLVHRRAESYADPESFSPDRFTGRALPGHTWIPFGGGYRRCPGAAFAMLEMRVVLQTIIDHAHLAPARTEPEAIRSHNILFAPARGGEVVLNDLR
jgi:cytochrome P450